MKAFLTALLTSALVIAGADAGAQQLTGTPIRLSGDSVSHVNFNMIDSNSVTSPLFVTGDYASFEIGLFDRGNFRTTLSQFTNATLSIWSAQNSTNLWMFQTITNGQAGWNSACTSNNWLAPNTADTNWHLQFNFTPGQTAFLTNTQESASLWLRLAMTTTDAIPRVVTYLEGPITIENGPINDLYVAPSIFGLQVDGLGNLLNPLNFFSAPATREAMLAAIGATAVLDKGVVQLNNGWARVYSWAANTTNSIELTYYSANGVITGVVYGNVTNSVSFDITAFDPANTGYVAWSIINSDPRLTAMGEAQILTNGIAYFVAGVATVLTPFASAPNQTNIIHGSYYSLDGTKSTVTLIGVSQGVSLTFGSSNPIDTNAVSWDIEQLGATLNEGTNGDGSSGGVPAAVITLNGLQNEVAIQGFNTTGTAAGIAVSQSGQTIFVTQTNLASPIVNNMTTPWSAFAPVTFDQLTLNSTLTANGPINCAADITSTANVSAPDIFATRGGFIGVGAGLDLTGLPLTELPSGVLYNGSSYLNFGFGTAGIIESNIAPLTSISHTESLPANGTWQRAIAWGGLGVLTMGVDSESGQPTFFLKNNAGARFLTVDTNANLTVLVTGSLNGPLNATNLFGGPINIALSGTLAQCSNLPPGTAAQPGITYGTQPTYNGETPYINSNGSPGFVYVAGATNAIGNTISGANAGGTVSFNFYTNATGANTAGTIHDLTTFTAIGSSLSVTSLKFNWTNEVGPTNFTLYSSQSISSTGVVPVAPFDAVISNATQINCTIVVTQASGTSTWNERASYHRWE